MKNKTNNWLLVLIIILLAIILFFVAFKKPVSQMVGNTEQSDWVVDTTPQDPGPIKTDDCVVDYNKTEESKVVSEESPALITKIEKKCDGKYYVAIDYLGPSSGDPESGNGSYYTNTNLKLRTFRVLDNAKVVVLMSDYNETKTFTDYYTSLKPMQNEIFGVKNALMRNGATSPVYTIKVQNGEVVSLSEVYLP